MNIDKLFDLATAAAPELDGRFYIVDAAELPKHSRGCCGFCVAPEQSHMFREFVNPSWDGEPRCVVALDEGEICGNGLAAETVFLHELAHVWQYRNALPIDVECFPSVIERQPSQLQTKLATHKPPEPKADREHGDHFIRRAIHFYVRSRLSGWRVPIRGLLTPLVSPPEKYLAALAAEIVGLENETLEAIEQTRPPAAFRRLCERDNVFIFESS